MLDSGQAFNVATEMGHGERLSAFLLHPVHIAVVEELPRDPGGGVVTQHQLGDRFADRCRSPTCKSDPAARNLNKAVPLVYHTGT